MASPALKTGKPHVSYSEVKNWLDCSWRHMLIYVKKVGSEESLIFGDFGGVIHSACEEYLKTRKMDVDKAKSEMTKIWEERKYPGENWPKYVAAVPELNYWLDSMEAMLNSVPSFMEKTFPEWELVDAEELLMEEIGDTGVKLKGYIDGIIKVPNKKGKMIYHIIDWKNTGYLGWHIKKKREFNVQLQLVLYKFFWSKKHDVDLKDIRCSYIFLKRHNPDPEGARKEKEKGKNRCDTMSVSVGPKTQEKAMKILRNMAITMVRGLALKNRESCMFCDFHKTEFCR